MNHFPQIKSNYKSHFSFKIKFKGRCATRTKQLQSMLDVCHNVGSSLDIAFNSSKSYLFKVGPGFAEYLSRLNIGCDDI